MKITALFAKQILDSRGYPTLSTTIVLKNKYTATFDVPSGKSTGIHEACELRDHKDAFQGYSVSKAVANTKKIAQKIVNTSFTQHTLDATLLQLDGTPNKSRLGANTLLGISIAFCKAICQSKTDRTLETYSIFNPNKKYSQI